MTVFCIIPCYNSGATITRSVQSVLDQTVPVAEIIIIDDGSDIATKKVLDKLKQDISIVTIITQENKGASAARNTGIQYCSSEYVLMLDADDTFEPEYLEKAIPLIEADAALAMVMCYYYIKNDKEEDIPRALRNASFKEYLFSNYGVACGLYRRKALLDVGGYDEAMLEGYEDWELLLHLKKHKWDFVVLPEYLFNYYNSPNSRNKEALKKDRKIKKFIFLKYKEDYIIHYEDLLAHFTDLVSSKEATILKREQSIDFIIGKSILAPFRKIKSWIS